MGFLESPEFEGMPAALEGRSKKDSIGKERDGISSWSKKKIQRVYQRDYYDEESIWRLLVCCKP